MKIKLYLSPKITRNSGVLNVFCFIIDRALTKGQVTNFVEANYMTEVLKVNTLIRSGKEKKKGRFVYTKQSKKFAYVTLKNGANTIQLMQEMAQSFMRKHGLGSGTDTSLNNDDTVSVSEDVIDDQEKEVILND